MNMTEIVRMFERVGLQINIGKTKVMLCTSGLIWGYPGDSGVHKESNRRRGQNRRKPG